MLTNINTLNKEDLDLVRLPLPVYCAKCDHIMKKSSKVYKIDGATYRHIHCPDLPWRRMSDARREDKSTRYRRSGDTIRYKDIYTVIGRNEELLYEQ